MSVKLPLVSIGMPIYNEEAYLRKALDSLLSQDFNNIELIICDNASVDGTQRICLEYAERDGRIRYHRNEANEGAINNFNRAFNLSSGEYFMWAAGHDVWAPTYLSRCVEALEEDSSVVLTYPRAVRINAEGEKLGILPNVLDTRGLSGIERFNAVIWSLTPYHVYGLIRASVLRETRLNRNVPGADHILVMELALHGAFAQIPEALFYVRRNRTEEGADQIIEGQLSRIFGTKKQRGLFPYIRMLHEQVFVGSCASVCLPRKVALILSSLLWTGVRHRRYLLYDVRYALKMLRRGIRLGPR